MKSKHKRNLSSDQLVNIEHNHQQRAGDFRLIDKVTSLPRSHDAPYGINDETRTAFANMRNQLERDQLILTQAQRAWANRLIKKLADAQAHTKKRNDAPTGDRSPVVSRTPAETKAWRKVERWCDTHGPRSTESAPTPTGDRSPVASAPNKSKPTKAKRKRLAKRRENRLDRWIDTHPSAPPT